VSPSKVVVYTGPTISADEVHAVLPQAQLRAPAARGDLLAEQWSSGDVAVVIDGYFREQRSLGHKEILRLLADGVHVVGAASMGALRAAELAPCGMHGVGEVYDMYAAGEIDGDDEVGMLHGPAAMGYPPQTVALVNLRYGCSQGAGTQLVPAATGARIVAAAKALPFAFRTWPDIAREVGADDHDALRTLERMIGSGDWDLKRRDARSALQAVRSGDTGTPGPVDVTFTGISDHQVLTRRSRREYAPGRWMSDLDVLNAARLFDDDYPARHEDLLSGLLAEFAAAEGKTLPQLSAGDSDREAEQSVAGEKTIEAFAYAKLGVDDLSPLPEVLASWLTDAETAELGRAEQIRLVLVRVWPLWQSADWRPAAVARLRESGRWEQWCDIVARADEAAEQARYRLVVPPPAICAKLFLRHWQQRGTSPEIELARRGFGGPDELGGTVRKFFALDMQHAREARR
jgi:hypothetical protein